MNQKLIALIGHCILFALTMKLAMSIGTLGLIDLFFWSAIAIGLWSALGTPRAWGFSSFLGALQPIIQGIIFMRIMLANEPAVPDSTGGSEGGEIFLIIDMVKSWLIVIVTIGLARLGVALLRREPDDGGLEEHR
jgi:hypothetical protein